MILAIKIFVHDEALLWATSYLLKHKGYATKKETLIFLRGQIAEFGTGDYLIGSGWPEDSEGYMGEAHELVDKWFKKEKQ